ncbi:AAA family ATPase [Chamaesiphon minutus]|uniref:Replication-associated recombination protein A n=1 Tax=Chamaesiphon minutus (strain ATCC 27169 / PCC 6605) TaxID=1173020 RepID=K9UHL3_CHAP6|nr:AAA family ATPase [Chamaesiphon minutus]AFY94143.1 AAA ATPase [Chamaesiphon minutus PCC 6605]
MDLFEHHRQQITAAEAPLADRLRPRTLEEFIGQEQILGQGRLLRRAICADRLSSLIFYGPPGTGKTTLARIIANTTNGYFIAINAVLAGVKEIREAIDTAQTQRGMYARRTILFVDEVHRFNKAQQDALLPWVENGTIILIGATTENPFFEVNKALVSRSRLFQLKPLTATDLRQVLQQALQDDSRGYGKLKVSIDEDAIAHLANVANGDARSLLNALELAVETTAPATDGTIAITLAVAEESIQQRAVLYDKEGDTHFDTISAFIKSVRGSDPDAALYWLAKMVYAGEEPRFILRRLLILASEDIGLADPQALVVVNACAQAFDRVGLPEGRYPLAQATLYLANAPKSNSIMGFFDALAAVESERQSDVPNPLKDNSRDNQGFGHGKGYLYPHAYRDHWIEQQYLPGSLQGRVFYQPSAQGAEGAIKWQVERHREAQLAAMVSGMGMELPEILTFSPNDLQNDRWLQRTLSQTGDRQAKIRDRLFALLSPQRHHVILDLNSTTGLLTWEALRQVPEGGVYTLAPRPADAIAIQEQSASLPELLRPMVMVGSLSELPAQIAAMKFDGIVGNCALMRDRHKCALIQTMANFLQPDGKIALYESIPRHTQRIYQLLDFGRLEISPDLRDRWIRAEEAIYTNPDDGMTNWDVEDLRSSFERAEFTVEMEVESTIAQLQISSATIERWFTQNNSKPTYASYLSKFLTKSEIEIVQQAIVDRLLNKTVNWQSKSVVITAKFNSRELR